MHGLPTQVGPTQRPCTKGLWMWSDPIPMTAADGSTFHMVLLVRGLVASP